MHTLFRQARNLGGGGLHVPPWHQHQRNEAARRSVAPVVQMPVVVGLDRGQGHCAIRMILETLTGKTRERREAQGTEHAVSVHVVNTIRHAPGAAAHLVIAQRLHAVLFFWSANYRVQAHVAGGLLFENPHIAFAALDDMGLAPFEALRHVASKGVWWLDGMVINADENEIFNLHCSSPSQMGSLLCSKHRTRCDQIKHRSPLCSNTILRANTS